MFVGLWLTRFQSIALFDQHAPNALGKQSRAEVEEINALLLEMFDGVSGSVITATTCIDDRDRSTFTRKPYPRTRFSLAEILVLAGTAGAGRIVPPASTRISARMKWVQGPAQFTREHATRRRSCCCMGCFYCIVCASI